MSARHPRLLVLAGNEIARDFSTGITVANLLDGWPEDRLAQVCMIPSQGDAPRLTPRTVVLPANGGVVDLPVRWALRRLRAARAGGSDAAPSTGVIHTGGTPRPAGATLLELGPVRLSSEARGLVRSFRPEVVYSPLSGIRMMRLARALSRVAEAPVVPHFLDDWPTTMYRDGELRGRPASVLNVEVGRLVGGSRSVGVISRAMAREYESRYGVRATPLMNCVDVPSGDATPAPPRREGVRFAYVGGLHLGRAEVLLGVAAGLRAVPGAQLVVHAPPEELVRHREAFAAMPGVQWGPSLPADDVPAALHDADVLVHLESFENRTTDYTRLSISTKIPQYLASGRPVLAIGPATLASIEHLAASDAAVLVTDDRLAGLPAALEALASSPEGRARRGRAAMRYARMHHDAPTVRQDLLELLGSARR